MFFERGLKKDILIVIALLTCSVLLLFSPVSSRSEQFDTCPTIFYLNQHMKIAFGCDSTEFLQLSRYPERLPFGSVYQSRPLYVLLASLLGLPFLLVYKTGILDGPALAEWIGSISDTSLGVDVFLYVVPYLFLNFFFLGLALFIFKKITSPKQWNFSVLFLALPLVVNIVTKKSLFSVHSQMFNVLLPLFILFFSYRYLLAEKFNNKQLYIGAILSGFLLLLYGSFAIIPLVFFSLYFYKHRLFEIKENIRAVITKFSLASLLFVLPYISWMGFCMFLSGEYNSYEVEVYRQFVWVVDVWQQGGEVLFSRLVENFFTFALISWQTLWPFALILLIVAPTVKRSEFNKQDKYFFVSALIVTFFLLLFFYLMGYYEARLSFNLAPVFLVVMAWILNWGKQKAKVTYFQNGIIFLFVATWCFYIISLPI